MKDYVKTDCKFLFLDETQSTNDYLKSLAEKGAQEKTVVIADRQTGGKGRLGRSFFSPESGIYMSILLRPQFSAEKSLFITTAAAVATALAIEEASGKKTGIKWVNDIFINKKKVSGILTEGSVNFKTDKFNYAVVGIGVNFLQPECGFPDELKDIAGAVFKKKPKDSEIKKKLIAKIIDNFFKIYNDFENDDFMKIYKKKSIIIGKKVYVIKKDSKLKAKAIDIDDNAHLVVVYKDGERETLYSGEVSIRL